MSIVAPPIRVLVVGGTSRAARAFRRLASSQHDISVRTLVRRNVPAFPHEAIEVVSDYFSPPAHVLENIDVAINFVGLTQGRSLAELTPVNIDGPVALARRVRDKDVPQFIQLSSLHVYGGLERIGRNTPERPLTPYGISKLMADEALAALAGPSFAVTLLRPPVLYGEGAGDNLRKLALMMAKLGWFPVSRPLGRRATLHMDNLAVALTHILRRKIAGVQFAADATPMTFDVLAEVTAGHFGRPIRLVSVPGWLLHPVRLASAGLYRRLFADNMIEDDALLPDMPPMPVKLRDGLRDLFSVTRE